MFTFDVIVYILFMLVFRYTMVVGTPAYHPGFPLCIQFTILGRLSSIYITELAFQITTSIT
jgi:hypothetical protein